MGAVVHQINCATSRKNTGFGGCPVDWKLIAGAFIFDGPKTFSAAELANLQIVLQNLAWSDSKALRAYPIGGFLNPADNTEKPTIQTFSDGSKAKVRDGTVDWTFQFTAGGFCLLQALRTHNGNGSVYAIFYDKENKILGYNNGGNLSAIPQQIFDAEPWTMNTGSATAAYMVHFVFPVSYINENAEYAKADFDLSQIIGLQDIRMISNGFNIATGLGNVSFLTECGGSNLYDLYSTSINTTTIKGTNPYTGGDVQITSVTPIPGNKSFNIQLNKSDPDYPSDGNVVLTMLPPSGLALAGMPGYEAEPLNIEITSS